MQKSSQLSRRQLLKGTGALMVCVAAAPVIGANLQAPQLSYSINASQPNAWIEIREDNSVVIRTGKCDFGQGSIFTAYPQIIADELEVPLSAIKHVISGDTDRTPDGGGTFGLLRTNVLNLRKVAAYTREALKDLAAKQFSVPKDTLTVENGTIFSGNNSITYGELVKGQALSLTIPVSGELVSFRGLVVEGNPPLKAAKYYKIVGQSVINPIIEEKVRAKTTWVADVKLPNMLHARVIHPKTLGSTLISPGKIDKKRFPSTRIVQINNLLGVVAETEWEAIQAAQFLEQETQWSDWQGLPGSDNLHDYLKKEAEWDLVPITQGRANKGQANEKLVAKGLTLEAEYRVPYHKHAPIGPSMALADISKDGLVTVHTHSQNPQFLRSHIAQMLGVSSGSVIIRTYPGPGHYGRSNGGNAGAEAEAVLLAKVIGQPVRLQWMRPEDLQWSTQSAPAFANVAIALNKSGRIEAYKADHYGPPMQDDRPIGGLLAGLPTIDGPVPNHTNTEAVQGMANFLADGWVYGAVTNVTEQAHSTWQLGQQESPLNVGLRDHSMRTPTQFQQNFPREVAISEAAALAGIDALEFRIKNTDDRRLKNLLIKLHEESQWQTRISPNKGASKTGNQRQMGQGVSVMFRGNGYWACACELSVTPATGEITVERMTIAVDTGVVVNPLHLKRQVQAGALMGLSQALHEEVTFDKGAVTIRDWVTYPILKMAEIPELKVVLAPDPDTEIYGQGSEGANALVPSAIATAVFDATGKPIRQLPLRPEYIRTILAS